MKEMLLRVGIDTGTDGALGPIFDDSTFEYIPLSEGDPCTRELRTFRNTTGRTGKSLSEYLPASIADRKLHFDPEFDTFTYGDPTSKRTALLKLEKGDLLVFYAGLTPYATGRYSNGLYIIGYFTVDRVLDFDSMDENARQEAIECCQHNAHLKRESEDAGLVIVTGDPEKSRLLDRGILISQPKSDRRNRTYQAVSCQMESLLGITGSIQRSMPPRFIQPDRVGNLKKLIGIKE